MKLRILGLVVLSLALAMPVQAADINAAQMVQIDQNGSRNDVDLATSIPAGENNIGSVAVSGFNVSLPAGDNNIGNIDLVSSVPAGANLMGSVAVSTINTSLPEGDNEIGAVEIKDGTTGSRAVVENGALWVKSGAEVGTAKSLYAVSTAVTAGAEVEAASYTVTTGKTLFVNNIAVIASGLATVRLMSGSTEISRAMTTPSCQTAILPLYQALSVSAGTVVSIRVKNREASAMDVTGLMVGIEK